MDVKRLEWSGFIGGVIYWLFVFWSINQNPWFSFWKNALSDLGGGSANAPWIYNLGLVVTSMFVALFSAYLIFIAHSKIQTVGGAYISISAIFLALIGIFHEGRYPHVFVSTYFFIQFFLGALVYGIGSRDTLGIGAVFLFILAVVGALVKWPSTAILEAYEIILVMVFTLLVPLYSKNFTTFGEYESGG